VGSVTSSLGLCVTCRCHLEPAVANWKCCILLRLRLWSRKGGFEGPKHCKWCPAAGVSLAQEWAADMVCITATALNDTTLPVLGHFQPSSLQRLMRQQERCRQKQRMRSNEACMCCCRLRAGLVPLCYLHNPTPGSLQNTSCRVAISGMATVRPLSCWQAGACTWCCMRRVMAAVLCHTVQLQYRLTRAELVCSPVARKLQLQLAQACADLVIATSVQCITVEHAPGCLRPFKRTLPLERSTVLTS
jgi:hypothetical protein